jgi:diadenosine tetraphosphate (Ap4A) HIT family hydrolase
MPASRIALHPQLASDTHALGRTPSGTLLLHRNALLPWLILVPDTDVLDLLALPTAMLQQALDDCAQLDSYIRSRWGVDRVNFAAIGNIVPQLHLHLVGRNVGDCCWPLPVWGHLTRGATYAAGDIAAIRAEVAALWP